MRTPPTRTMMLACCSAAMFIAACGGASDGPTAPPSNNPDTKPLQHVSFAGTWTVKNPAVGFTLTMQLTDTSALDLNDQFQAIVGDAVGPATVTWSNKPVSVSGLRCRMMRHVFIDISSRTTDFPAKMNHTIGCQTLTQDVVFVFQLNDAPFGPTTPVTGPSAYANQNDGTYFGIPSLIPVTVTKS